MASAEPVKKDEYELRLDAMIEALKACQQEKALKSCSLCEQYLSCDLRKRYVSAVYDSMSKGETGGFEF
jgi:hypothetical protein